MLAFMAVDVAGIRRRVLDAEVAACHPLVREWAGSVDLREGFEAEIAFDLQRLEDLEFAAMFARNVPVEGCGPEAYLLRAIEFEGELVLAGIAYLALDPSRPFVHVARHTFEMTNDSQRDRLCDVIGAEFQVFRPERLRFYQTSHLAYQFPGCDGDLRLVGCPVTHVRQAEVEIPGNVSLRVVESLSWFEQYCEEYRAMHEARPWVVDVARVESRETLERYVADSMLFELDVDGEWAGVIAASRGQDGGMTGFCIGEILITRAHRGRGLGPVAYRLLVDALPADDGDCVFGTIGAVNRHALDAAKRVGRVDLGGYYWCPLASSNTP